MSRIEIPVQRSDSVESLVIHCCDEACLYSFSPAVFYFEFPAFRCSADEMVPKCLGYNRQFRVGAFAADDDFRCVKSVFFDERQCESERWTVIFLIRNLYFDVFVVGIQSVTFFCHSFVEELAKKRNVLKRGSARDGGFLTRFDVNFFPRNP